MLSYKNKQIWKKGVLNSFLKRIWILIIIIVKLGPENKFKCKWPFFIIKPGILPFTMSEKKDISHRKYKKWFLQCTKSSIITLLYWRKIRHKIKPLNLQRRFQCHLYSQNKPDKQHFSPASLIFALKSLVCAVLVVASHIRAFSEQRFYKKPLFFCFCFWKQLFFFIQTAAVRSLWSRRRPRSLFIASSAPKEEPTSYSDIN